MRVLVLTAEPRLPDFKSLYASLASHLEVDLRILQKEQQRDLKSYLRQIPLAGYERILLDLPFKNVYRQTRLLARLPHLTIYEQDACQNYLDSSRWKGKFSRFYRRLPGARIVVTGASVARRLAAEGFDATFIPKAYDPQDVFLEERGPRDIELGFIGRTSSGAYAGRKALLDSLAACEPLQLLRSEPGDAYRHLLNRIRFFVSADVGLNEYMAKNFEAMACGCVLLAWRQGEEEQAIGLEEGRHLLLYSSLDELRAHLERLRGDPALAERIAQEGRQFVESRLGFPALAARLADELRRPRPARPVAPSRWAWLRALLKGGNA